MSERALTWSGKWHIVDQDHPEAKRYARGLCGAGLYRNDDPQYPSHLKLIRDGAKQAQDCKLCNRSSGIKTATVELPSPDETVASTPETHGARQWWVPGGVVAVFDSGIVEFDLGDYHGEDLDGVKRIAAALLAVVDAAERSLK